jgi:hypothetical protein
VEVVAAGQEERHGGAGRPLSRGHEPHQCLIGACRHGWGGV